MCRQRCGLSVVGEKCTLCNSRPPANGSILTGSTPGPDQNAACLFLSKIIDAPAAGSCCCCGQQPQPFLSQYRKWRYLTGGELGRGVSSLESRRAAPAQMHPRSSIARMHVDACFSPGWGRPCASSGTLFGRQTCRDASRPKSKEL